MESFLRAIQSHADEVQSALTDLTRHVVALEERGKQAAPAAAEFERVAKELAEKRDELAKVEAKVNAANAALAALRKQVS